MAKKQRMIEYKPGVCPECNREGSMKKIQSMDPSGNRFVDLECFDCGYYCYEGTAAHAMIGTKISTYA